MAFGELHSQPLRNGVYKTAGFHGRGVRIVNMGEMFAFDFISDQKMSRVDLTRPEISENSLFNGDLLFGRRSVIKSGAGKCSIVIEPPDLMTFESSIIRVRLDQTRAEPLFYYYFFQSPAGRCRVRDIITGTNVKGIRGSELKRLPVPVPPLFEQRAIAAALGDVDGLIGALDRLIAKKRDLKQAATQQLLTGQTRLPGFSGDWEVSSASDCCVKIQDGTHFSPKTGTGPYLYITSKNLGRGSLDLSSVEFIDEFLSIVRSMRDAM